MGWQDAPLLDDSQSAASAPAPVQLTIPDEQSASSAQPAWASAPVIDQTPPSTLDNLSNIPRDAFLNLFKGAVNTAALPVEGADYLTANSANDPDQGIVGLLTSGLTSSPAGQDLHDAIHNAAQKMQGAANDIDSAKSAWSQSPEQNQPIFTPDTNPKDTLPFNVNAPSISQISNIAGNIAPQLGLYELGGELGGGSPAVAATESAPATAAVASDPLMSALGTGGANVGVNAPNTYEDVYSRAYTQYKNEGKSNDDADKLAQNTAQSAVASEAPIDLMLGGGGMGAASTVEGNAAMRALKGFGIGAPPMAAMSALDYANQQSALGQPIDPYTLASQGAQGALNAVTDAYMGVTKGTSGKGGATEPPASAPPAEESSHFNEPRPVYDPATNSMVTPTQETAPPAQEAPAPDQGQAAPVGQQVQDLVDQLRTNSAYQGTPDTQTPAPAPAPAPQTESALRSGGFSRDELENIPNPISDFLHTNQQTGEAQDISAPNATINTSKLLSGIESNLPDAKATLDAISNGDMTNANPQAMKELADNGFMTVDSSGKPALTSTGEQLSMTLEKVNPNIEQTLAELEKQHDSLPANSPQRADIVNQMEQLYNSVPIADPKAPDAYPIDPMEKQLADLEKQHDALPANDPGRDVLKQKMSDIVDSMPIVKAMADKLTSEKAPVSPAELYANNPEGLKDYYTDQAERLGIEHIPGDTDDIISAVNDEQAKRTAQMQPDSMLRDTDRLPYENSADAIERMGGIHRYNDHNIFDHMLARSHVIGKGRETGNEHGVIVNNDTGKWHSMIDGTKSTLDLAPAREAMADSTNSFALHHNHPSDRPLSIPDIKMLGMPGVDHVIAHSNNGNFSGASLSDAMAKKMQGSPAFDRQQTLSKIIQNSRAPLEDYLVKAVQKGRITADQGDHAWMELLNRSLNNNNITNYTTSHSLDFLPKDIQIGAQKVSDDAMAKVVKNLNLGERDANDVNRRTVPIRPEEGITKLFGGNEQTAKEAGSIASNNASPESAAIDNQISNLNRFRTALESNDTDTIRNLVQKLPPDQVQDMVNKTSTELHDAVYDKEPSPSDEKALEGLAKESYSSPLDKARQLGSDVYGKINDSIDKGLDTVQSARNKMMDATIEAGKPFVSKEVYEDWKAKNAVSQRVMARGENNLKPMEIASNIGRIAAYSDDGLFEVLAKKFPNSQTVKDIQRIFHFQPGRGEGNGATYHEMIEQYSNRQMSKVANYMEPIKTQGQADRVRYLMTHPEELNTDKSLEGEVAAHLAQVVQDHVNFLKQNGYESPQTEGFYPRIPDTGYIVSNEAAFKEDAMKAYADTYKDQFQGIYDQLKTQHDNALDRQRNYEQEVDVNPYHAYDKNDAGTTNQELQTRRESLLDDIKNKFYNANGEFPTLEEFQHPFLKDKADNWFQNLMLNDQGLMNDPDKYFQSITTKPGAPSSFKERVLSKNADDILEKYYVRSPLDAMNKLTVQTARKGAWENFFGGKKMDTMYSQLIKDGLSGKDMHLVMDSIKANTGQMGGDINPHIKNGLALARYMAAVHDLIKAPFKHLSIGLNAANQLGRNPIDSVGHAYRAFVDSAIAFHRKSDAAKAMKTYNEVAALNGESANHALLRDQVGEPTTNPKLQYMNNRFYDAIGMTRLIGSFKEGLARTTKYGIADMANDINTHSKTEGFSRYILKDAGIPENELENFSKWVGDAGGRNINDAMTLDGSPYSKMYQLAMQRTIGNMVSAPTPAMRQLYASHPLMSMLYHMTGYHMAFMKRTIQRNARLAIEGTKTGKGYTPQDRLAFTSPMMMTLGTTYAFAHLSRVLGTAIASAIGSTLGTPQKKDKNNGNVEDVLNMELAGPYNGLLSDIASMPALQKEFNYKYHGFEGDSLGPEYGLGQEYYKAFKGLPNNFSAKPKTQQNEIKNEYALGPAMFLTSAIANYSPFAIPNFLAIQALNNNAVKQKIASLISGHKAPQY